MSIADLKQRSFDKYGNKQPASLNQVLVIKVAAVPPWWCAVPAAHFLRRRHTGTAKKRVKRNTYAVGKRTDHILHIERNDAHLTVKDLVRKKAGHPDRIVPIWYGQ